MEKTPDGYRFRIEDNPNTLNRILKADGNPASTYTPGGELQNIIHCRSVADMEDKPNAWLKTTGNAKVTRIICSTKTIENRWDGIVSMAKFGINSVIIEGVDGYIRDMRRSPFGFSDFDFFGLLILEHTHKKAKGENQGSFTCKEEI